MRKTCLILLLCVLIFSLRANNTNMIVRNYAYEHGLPHNSVYAAMKDHQGLMWFATWYGLSSFDGVKFHKYNIRDDYNADIPPHKIQNLIEANENCIWVKTIDHKLFLFDKKTESFFDVFNEIKKKYNVSPKIIKIQKTDGGNLLLLTKNRDLLLAKAYDNGRIGVNLLFDSQVNSVRKAPADNLLIENRENINWIGNDYKIFTKPKGKSLLAKPADFITTKLGGAARHDFSASYLSGNILYTGDKSGNIAEINLINGNIVRKPVFPGKEITYIIGKQQNNLIVALADGIWELDGQFNVLRKIISLDAGEIVTQAFTDSYDKRWIILNQRAVIYYDPVNNEQKKFSIPSGRVLPDIVLTDGQELGLFVLTTSGDVIWFDRQNISMSVLNAHKDLKYEGQDNSFFHLMLDNSKILWLSSTIHGVYRVSFPRQQFNILQISGEQATGTENSVKTLYQSKDGDIWVATRKPSLYRLDKYGNVLQQFSGNTSFNPGSVYHIMEDRNGTFWLSTKGSGLVRAVPDRNAPGGFVFTRFLYDERDPYSISGNEVYYTCQDSHGNIWVALFGAGLNLLRETNGKIRFYNKNNSFEQYPGYGLYMEVRSVLEDKNGRMWVATSDGLMSFESNFKNPNQIKFEIYRNEMLRSNVLDNDIYALYRDSEGDIWISVFGGGLNKLIRYDSENGKPEFRTYSTNEGLNSDVILSIVEDDHGFLWLATENSISRFNKKTESFRNFDRYDGFIDVKMEEGSAIKCQSGDIWFGNRMGVLAFNPEKIETYNVDYQTIIVDFLVSNKELKSFREDPILKGSISYAESITLKYNQNNFVVEFAALNYYNLNRVSYKYILEGYEDEWHYNGKNRIASYPNVPPGKYVFVVETMDEGNKNLKSERRLVIRVLPPWWRSWWAYAVYTLLGLLAAFGIQKLVLFAIRMRNDVYIEQKVSEMKIRFFTNISHELRTPLTLIMGPIHELREKQHLTEKGKQYIALIEKSANQMLQLVNQILDFRKLQHGKMVLHVAHIDLNKLMGTFVNEFAILSEEKQISYTFQLSEEEIMVWADKERLEIVVRNIISNAFKFTNSGGGIFVSTGLSEDKTSCFIRIEDTGVGIPQGKVDEIFERFTQAENSKHAYYQGTGIGLHLSREIISLHHGEISVQTEQHKGTAFTILLKLDKDHFRNEEVNFYLGEEDEHNQDAEETTEAAGSISTAEDSETDLKLPLVLVVEDNKDMCDLLRLQLEDKYKILVAHNGREGLKKVAHYHPDLVITDLMMPEMNGTEMLQEIRKDIGISHIPVIILTAKHNEDAKIQAISMGANAYITKPFNKDYLIARVEQLLNDRRMFRERIWNQEKGNVVAAEETYENYLVKKDVQLLEKIHQVIGENIQNPEYNIDAIAESLGFSRSAFFKKLKSLTGLAPVDLIKEIRLSKSVELLKTTDMTISEVAFEVGFRDSGYYGKCFRKKYHMTPTEFVSQFK